MTRDYYVIWADPQLWTHTPLCVEGSSLPGDDKAGS